MYVYQALPGRETLGSTVVDLPRSVDSPVVRLVAGCQNGPAQVIETPWCPGADVGDMVFSMPGYRATPLSLVGFMENPMENPIQMDDDWGYPYFSMKWDDVHLKTT